MLVRASPAIGLEAVWARHADEVRAAQRLRWRVFAEELGARLSPPPGTPPGHDVDAFDGHCEHLRVVFPGQQGGCQGSHHAQGQRVEGLGAVQRDEAHTPLALGQNVIGISGRQGLLGGHGT